MTESTLRPYTSSWEHLHAELGYLDLLLGQEVLRSRRTLPKDQPAILRGLVISESEVEHLLDGISRPPVVVATAKAGACRHEIEGRKRASLEHGVYLALPRLTHLFGLTPFEEQAALICLAPELDLRYGRLYAYLQDDATRTQPSGELVMRLLCATPDERLPARRSLSPQAPLLRAHILRPFGGEEQPLLARPLKMDELVVNHLLGVGGASQDLVGCLRLVTAPDDLRRLRWPEHLKRRLVEVARDHLETSQPGSRRLIYHLFGPPGTGRKSLAAGICRELGVPMLVVDVREVLLRTQSFDETLRRILREGLLRPAPVYLDDCSQLLGEDPQAVSRQRSLAHAIDEFSWLTFIATEQRWEPQGLFREHLWLTAELPAPDLPARAELWPTLAADLGEPVPEMNWADLAIKFRLTPGQMRAALIDARNHAHLRPTPPGAPSITPEELYTSCRRQSNQRLSALAHKLSPQKGWADITLPAHAMAQLREVCAHVTHRRTVYERWGFGRKQTLGQGLCALFFGPSGTGKTLAVEVIAHELRLDAFKIDLSTVVSKYIGETEKNLSRVFHEAETSNAILFFDEADALFGKRSEVKDAHDRYANIEISYLLQRMEEFDGLVILATNLRKHIDEAFFRRMHFAVEFPFPDETHRYRIWKQHLPEAAPVAEDVDYDFLANRINLTGGNIRNVVVNAAFLAAENSGVIHMQHFVRAARREYEKIGRLCTEAEFAPYHGWLSES